MIIIMHSQVFLTDTLNSVFVDIVFGKGKIRKYCLENPKLCSINPFHPLL